MLFNTAKAYNYFAVDCGFSCRPWIWADSISFEEHLKSHQTKKQDSQVVAPAGFSDIIDTTHRLLLCHGTFYWFAIRYRYKGFHYLYLRWKGHCFVRRVTVAFSSA